MTVTINGNGTITPTSAVQPAGSILQVVQTYKTDTFSATLNQAVESSDITGLTASITPASSSNKILVIFDVATGNSASSRLGITLYKAGSTLTASTGDAAGSTTRFTAYGSTTAADRHWGISGKYLDTAGGTSSITYSLRMRHGNASSNTLYDSSMSLDHEAIYKAYANVVTIDDTAGAFDKDGNKVTLVQSNIDAAKIELAKEDYKWKRAAEYPSVVDQLDDIYHNGIDAWKATIKTTKDKYPKS